MALFITVTAHGDDLALQVLEEVNLARTQPQQYAQLIAGSAESWHGSEGAPGALEAADFLQRARPLPPLAWSSGIGQAALSHARDLGPRGGNGHYGSRGDSPWKRMARFGQWQGYAGENIDYGHRDPRSIVMSLIIDNGVRSRLHRKNLFNRNYRVTGIGIGPHASWGTMCVMDFASGFVEAGEQRVASRAGAGFHSIYSGMSFF